MEALAEAGANVVGIDASEGYLEGARRNRSHTNIPYEHGDIRHMSSTAVLSTRPFQRWPWAFLPEFEQVVAEIKRVTRPGGVVASGVHQFLAAFPHSTSSVTPQPFLTLLLRAEVHAGGAQALLAKWSGGVVAEDGPHQRDEAPVVVDCECPSFLIIGCVHQRPRQHVRRFDGALERRARRNRAACSRPISGWVARWTSVISHDVPRGARRDPRLILENVGARTSLTFPTAPTRNRDSVYAASLRGRCTASSPTLPLVRRSAWLPQREKCGLYPSAVMLRSPAGSSAYTFGGTPPSCSRTWSGESSKLRWRLSITERRA